MSVFSITEEICDCHALQDAADDPAIPIVFDAVLNEFHLIYEVNGGQAQMNIYHCFLCGGRAPESNRDRQFAIISEDERRRLRNLTGPLKTLGDLLAVLGTPDHDFADGVMIRTPEAEDHPPHEQAFRSLVYQNLSDTAEILVTVYPDDRVGIGFTGKYIGHENKG